MSRIILMFALLLGLVACGTDEDSGAGFEGGVDAGETPVEPAPTTEDNEPLQDPEGADDELIDSIEAYALTQIQGDPDELVQARSQGCAELDTDLDVGEVETEGIDEDLAVRDLEAEVENDEATVSYRLEPSGETVTDERWVREDGEWKWDNC